MELGTLFFEDDFGFFGGLLFFAKLARDIAERSGFRNRAKFPQGALALSVGVCTAADQRMLPSHWHLLRGTWVIGYT